MLPPPQFSPETPSLALRLALLMVRMVRFLVPASERRAWHSEWTAELVAYDATAFSDADRPGGRLSRHLSLIWRTLGCVPDALSFMGLGFGPTALLADLRHAGRSLAKRPGFTLTAVITLALGIGANTALFSVVRGVLLRPLPYHEPDRLVQLQGHRQDAPPGSGNVSYPNLHDLGAEVQSLDGVVGLSSWRPAFTGADPEVVAGATVTWNYFQILGVAPTAGRFFHRDEEGAGRAPSVVLSYGLWTRRFARDPSLVGRAVEINNTPYQVVGVTSEDFEGPHLITFEGEQPEVWRTPWFDAQETFRSGRSWRGLARLAPGTSLVAAQNEISAAMTRLVERFPEDNANRTITASPLQESVVGPSRSALYLLLGSVILVLLVTCVNVATLLVGRMLERRNELLVRSALGAPAGRLIMHLFSESVAIALCGAALGILLAEAGVAGILSVAGAWLPRSEAVAVDWTVLAFCGGLAGGTAVLFGLLPALSVVGNARLSTVSTARAGGPSRRTLSLRRAVVMVQIAASVLLVVGAGLLVQTLRNLYAVDLGIAREGVLTMDLHGAAWWDLEPEVAASRYRDIMERVGQLPGVSSAGGIDVLPLADNYSCDGFIPLDRPPPGPGEGLCAEVRSVTPGALEALGVRADQGRLPDWGDDGSRHGAMTITRRTADVFWPGEDALGRRAHVHDDTFTVAGVVPDIRHFGPEAEISSMAFLPALQEGWNGVARGFSLVVRGTPAVEDMGSTVRNVVREIDSSIAVEHIRPLDELLSDRMNGPRLRALLISAFAVLALIIALVGIAGVMGQAVTRRRRELGIRIALGSTPGEAMRLLLSDGGRMIGAGLALGLLAAVGFTRFLSGFVFGIEALDPQVILLGGILVLGLGLLASWLPARRAALIDPVEALREE